MTPKERKEMEIRRQKRIDALRRMEAGDETAFEDYLGASKPNSKVKQSPNIAIVVAKQLRRIKDMRQLTVKDIADGTDVDRGTVDRMIHGRITKPNFAIIIKLADYFEVSTDYFRGKADD